MEHTNRLDGDLMESRVVQQQYARERSVLSWSAIVAGAFAIAAFSLILLTLGTGLGLSSLSPWPGNGAHAKTFGFAAIVWVCVTQVMSAGLGGYLAGRLRRHWPGISTEETHFRDTAHGFLAWSLATLLTAIVLASAVAGLAREGLNAATAAGENGARMAATAVSPDRGNAPAAYATWPVGYLIDGMLRPAAGVYAAASGVQGPDQAFATAAQKQEITRIFLNSLPARGALSPEDTDYVARIVAQKTGLTPEDSRARVTTTWQRLEDKMSALDNSARAAADEARKASIHVTLWLFVSLLMGAFAASFMATIGGRMREL